MLGLLIHSLDVHSSQDWGQEGAGGGDWARVPTEVGVIHAPESSLLLSWLPVLLSPKCCHLGHSEFRGETLRATVGAIVCLGFLGSGSDIKNKIFHCWEKNIFFIPIRDL